MCTGLPTQRARQWKTKPETRMCLGATLSWNKWDKAFITGSAAPCSGERLEDFWIVVFSVKAIRFVKPGNALRPFASLVQCPWILSLTSAQLILMDVNARGGSRHLLQLLQTLRHVSTSWKLKASRGSSAGRAVHLLKQYILLICTHTVTPVNGSYTCWVRGD